MNDMTHMVADKDRYANDRAWSDQIMPSVENILSPILGRWLLKKTTEERDRKHAADLTILKVGNLEIAVRVRRASYAERYKYDFTLRHSSGSGDTEFQKIQKGACNWFFYGHAKDLEIPIWSIIDLDVFRHAIRTDESLIPNAIRNKDGSAFLAFDIRKFKQHPELLINTSLKKDELPWKIS